MHNIIIIILVDIIDCDKYCLFFFLVRLRADIITNQYEKLYYTHTHGGDPVKTGRWCSMSSSRRDFFVVQFVVLGRERGQSYVRRPTERWPSYIGKSYILVQLYIYIYIHKYVHVYILYYTQWGWTRRG